MVFRISIAGLSAVAAYDNAKSGAAAMIVLGFDPATEQVERMRLEAASLADSRAASSLMIEQQDAAAIGSRRVTHRFDFGMIGGGFHLPVKDAFFEAAVGKRSVWVSTGGRDGTTGQRQKNEECS